MKSFPVILLLFPLFGLAQYNNDQKLSSKVSVLTDSGRFSGYYVIANDSAVVLSTTKRYALANTLNVPVNSIREIHLKERSPITASVASVVFVFGFTLTAGLTKNFGDVDNDGKTAFWELVYTAIEGSTSKDRRRRNTALIVGAAGGTLAMAAYLLSNDKLSLVFPLNGRRKYYDEKRADMNKYAKF